MNFHTFTVATVYLFVILILHVIIKNNNSQIYSENDVNMDSGYDTDVSENEMIIDLETIDNLKNNSESNENINKEQSNSIQQELLKYLNLEKKETSELKKDFLKKTTENSVKPSNISDNRMPSNFTDQKTNLSDNFEIKHSDLEKNKIFDNVTAYDDLDTSYALFT